MKALIVVDMQNDFMPGGALPTKGADALVFVINALMEDYPIVLAVSDSHPQGHVSFVTSHPGKKVGDVVQEGEIEQILWPEHCVQGTKGAEFVPGLKVERFEHVFYKGTDPKIDSYSAFFDNAKKRKTGLEEYLKSHQIKEITLVGVATEYCVLYSVQDAVELGFDVTVISNACRAINLKPNDGKRALDTMKNLGAKVV